MLTSPLFLSLPPSFLPYSKTWENTELIGWIFSNSKIGRYLEMLYYPISGLLECSENPSFFSHLPLGIVPWCVHLLAFTQTDRGASAELSSDSKLLPLPMLIVALTQSSISFPGSVVLGTYSRWGEVAFLDCFLPFKVEAHFLREEKQGMSKKVASRWLEKRSQAKKRGTD